MNFKEQRLKHNLSANELAKLLSISPAQIYRWDAKGISQYNKYYGTICKIFNVTELDTDKKFNKRTKDNTWSTHNEISISEIDYTEQSRPTSYPQIRRKR